MKTSKKIAEGEGFEFWMIGSEVFRSPKGTGLDTDGLPMSRHWECSLSHWNHFRAVFAWAKDV